MGLLQGKEIDFILSTLIAADFKPFSTPLIDEKVELAPSLFCFQWF